MAMGCVGHAVRWRRAASRVVCGGVLAVAAGCAPDARYVLVDCWTLDPHVRAEAQGAGHCLDPFATYRVPRPPTQVAARQDAGGDRPGADPAGPSAGPVEPEPPPSGPSPSNPPPGDPLPSDPPPDDPPGDPPDDPEEPEDAKDPEDPGGPHHPGKGKPGKGRSRSSLLDGFEDVLAGLGLGLGS